MEAMLDEQAFLMALKDYIEQAETGLMEAEDEDWDLARAIADGDMPEIYYEVLERLRALGAEDAEDADGEIADGG